MKKQAIPIPKVKQIMEIVEKQAIPIPKVKKLLQIMEKQAPPIPKVKKLLQIMEKRVIPIPEVKKIIRIIEKQTIPIPEVKKIIQIIEKQAIPIPEAKEIIRIIKKQTLPIPEVKKIIQIIETAKTIPKKEFEPSMKTLLRIMESISEDGADVKTSLALKTNLNYSRLAEHIVWLEKKGLVKSIISEQKINVALTQKGRIFVTMLVT